MFASAAVILSALLLPALVSADQPFDVAAGCAVTVSSIQEGCAVCAGSNVVANNPYSNNPNPTQWISAAGGCEKSRNETIYLDWSAKYHTVLLSEVRFRYGSVSASDVELILYSETPMNVPVPTAVTYEDGSDWIVFVFNEPNGISGITASGLMLVFTGLGSASTAGVNCAVAVSEVQAWI
ncbi:hypothetical protein HK101_011390, partial [Irineochytrium annulatum]